MRLTRGLDLNILTRGYGVESRGVMVSYQAQAPVLGLVLPSNSPGVHTLWLPVIPMQIGLLLKPGPQEPWTPYRMAAAFMQAGVPKEAIAIYPGLGDMGAEVVRLSNRTMIFGGTATVERYRGDPRVQVHGPGFSKILLGDDVVDQWEKYIDVMADSVFLNSGRGCINCSGIWASRHTKEIAQALAERLGPVEPKPPEDPKASLAAFTVPGAAKAIWNSIEGRTQPRGRRARHGQVRPAPGGEGALRLRSACRDSLRLAGAHVGQHRVHVSIRERRTLSAERNAEADRSDAWLAARSQTTLHFSGNSWMQRTSIG